MASPLRICLVASEVAPFAKTGGLADVAASLPRWLGRAGHDVRIFMPLYRSVLDRAPPLQPSLEVRDVDVGFANGTARFSVRTAPLPDSNVHVYFVDCPALYDRDGIYGDGADEPVRFALLARAAIEACQRMQWAPHVFHCNDWHTGLLPLYLKTWYSWDQTFARTATVLTIHNLSYQGVFGADVVDALDLGNERHRLHQKDLEQGKVGFLKTGLLYADRLSTVSRTYAREIQTPEHGMGLDDMLRARSKDLVGIVNGIDYGSWNPTTDPHLPHHYHAGDLSGKARVKQELLDRFSVSHDPRAPLFGIVTRLFPQKGIELLAEALPALLKNHDVRICALGSGESRYEEFFQRLRDTRPDKVAFYRGYNEELAHWIEAGSDVFLMPSHYEPCGLNQMYSLKYGTPPVVRRTGGLADTVTHFDPYSSRGDGFTFDDYSATALYQAIERALAVWREPHAWHQLIQNGMAADWSWDHQGPEYVAMYRSLTT